MLKYMHIYVFDTWMEQVADLVAQLAERDYPQRWEGFLDQMMQVSSVLRP